MFHESGAKWTAVLDAGEQLGDVSPALIYRHRFAMRYPPMPALAVLRYDLPEDPTK
jgi:hypothetical protein